jgi:hypothetical protein
VAIRFNVSPAWLSTIINSEAFLEARSLYTEVSFHETVLPMREKMVAAADKALDRLNELIPMEKDLDTVRKTAESVLAACGFSSVKGPAIVPGQTNIQQNNFFGNASPSVLAKARETIGQGRVFSGESDGRGLVISDGVHLGGGSGGSSVVEVPSISIRKAREELTESGRSGAGILAAGVPSSSQGGNGKDHGRTEREIERAQAIASRNPEAFTPKGPVRVTVVCGGEQL